jgi:hypothetical protein
MRTRRSLPTSSGSAGGFLGVIGCILSLGWMLESPAQGQLRNPNATPHRHPTRRVESENVVSGSFGKPRLWFITTLARDLFNSILPRFPGQWSDLSESGHIITNSVI